jgi:hypothetical protein
MFEIIWDRGCILLHMDSWGFYMHSVGLGQSNPTPLAPLDNTYSVSFHTSQ